jgi:ActR/RegA family two-component response regulator
MQTLVEPYQQSFKGLRKALVVDDDSTWQSIFVRCLGEGGLSVVAARSLSEAEHFLEREFFHVALVDLSLIGDDNRDGLKVVQKIYAELNEGGQALLLTAFGGMEEGYEAKAYGAFDALSKRKLNFSGLLFDIERATKKAQEALARYHVGVNLLSGVGTPEERLIQEGKILKVLDAGFDRVDGFALSLLAGLAPVLRRKDEPVPHIEGQTGLIHGRYWSKMLGTPFILLMGTLASVSEELGRRQKTEEYNRLLIHLRDGDMAGAILQTNQPTFDVFERRQDASFRQATTSRHQ